VINFRRTKIVATLGPASETREVLEGLIESGVNVVRLNFSHGTAEDHIARAKLVRSLAAERGLAVGVLVDLQGPKIRIGKFRQGKTELIDGQKFILDASLDLEAGTDERVGITYKALVFDVKPGDRLLLNDGLLMLDVEQIRGTEIICNVVRGGELSNNKGINRFGGGLSAEALTEKDRTDIITAVKLGADYVAISFPRSAKDVAEARRLVREAGGHAGIIAKIERAEAVKNLKEILDASDAVMVARGDLGVEIGDAAVPPVQSLILREAPKYNCPVIVATQMLESMINSPIPTRAEISDVANSVENGTDAVMLSAETASGKYPIEAVKAIHRTCVESEKQHIFAQRVRRRHHERKLKVDESIARSAMDTANNMPIKAIAAFTQSGSTVLYMSRYLSKVPIYALTPEEATLGKVTLYRNVIPRHIRADYGETDAPRATREVIELMLKDGLVRPGDLVVMTLGTPMGHAGATNTMKIVKIGETL
jgi:pyruvate kinase